MHPIAVLLLAVTLIYADVKVVDSIPKGKIVEWNTGDTILLSGIVYVDSSVLRIKPGVVIKAKKTVAVYDYDNECLKTDSITALVVTQKGYIFCRGTKDNPVIFTSELDSLTGAPLTMRTDTSNGLWGGIVILGSARINNPSGTDSLTPAGTSDRRLIYGGSDDGDSSGIMEYVSIRYAGSTHYRDDYTSSFAGLSLCGVGTKTHIRYIDVFKSYNDAIRINGGAVDLQYIAVHRSMRDAFQIDEGYHGHGQFWSAYLNQEGVAAEERRLLRIGGYAALSDTPVTMPFITNATLYTAAATPTVIFCQGGAGFLFNSIMRFGPAAYILVKKDSWSRTRNDSLMIEGNLISPLSTSGQGIGDWSQIASDDSTRNYLRTGNIKGDPKFRSTVADSLDFRPDTAICWIPHPGSGETSGLFDITSKYTGTFLQSTCFLGAFDPTDTMWIRGWTGLDHYGFVSTDDAPIRVRDTICGKGTGVISAKIPGDRPLHAEITCMRNGLRIHLHLPQPQEMKVRLYSLNGARLVDGDLGRIDAGNTSCTVPIRKLVPGMYIVRLTSGCGNPTFSAPVLIY